MEYCIKVLESKDFKIVEQTSTYIGFEHKGHIVKHYPYSGWHTGKTIKDGREFNKLLKQL